MMPDGESLGSSNLPFRGAKGTLYEGGVRTPAFIHIPHLDTGRYCVVQWQFMGTWKIL